MSNRQPSSNFLVGGRYRNRNGTYEVLEISGNQLRVIYDSGDQADLNAEIQNRIIRNIERETAVFEPYSGTDSSTRNREYFRTIGFLASRISMMEAIVPHRARAGFSETYRQLTRIRPSEGEGGYYPHGPEIDKWGNELRITFDASQTELQSLDFGPEVGAVVNPSKVGSSWRINNNFFWWELIRLGFRMGPGQSVDLMRDGIPEAYRDDFEYGLTLGNE